MEFVCCQIRGPESQDLLLDWKRNHRWVYMVREETDEKTDNLKTRQCVARNVGACVWCSQKQWMQSKKWAIEKPKLDNARKLRGIFFIEPNDEEFKHIMKNVRGKLEIPMPAAKPCKTPANCRGEACRNIRETQDQKCLYCRCRRIYESAIGRCAAQVSRRSHLCKRNKFTEPFQFGTWVYSDASSIKNTGCERCSGKRMGNSRKLPASHLTKVRNNRGDRRSKE